ncbi:MAG: EAL domain-containing protein [Burkholderiaceae bacterium]|nr:EAL domain-containing protein [Burkholderiaceae bacterium]
MSRFWNSPPKLGAHWSWGLLLALLITGAAGYVLRENENRSADAAFSLAATQQIDRLELKLRLVTNDLTALGAYLDASPSLDRAAFRRLALPLLEHNAALQALEWVPQAPDKERASLVASARRDGLAQFDFMEQQVGGGLVPASRHGSYFPVYFLEPLRGNENALGFDLASMPARRASLIAAAQSGNMAATGRIALVQSPMGSYGFLIFRPVYAEGSQATSPAERLSRLRGFALAVSRLDTLAADVVADVAAKSPASIVLTLLDDAAAPAEQLLYPKTLAQLEPDSTELPFRLSKQIHVADRTWTVLADPKGQAFLPRRTLSGTVIALGVLISLLWAWVLRQREQRVASIARAVDDRTAELRAERGRAQRLTEFTALRAQSNRCIAGATDAQLMLHEICEMAIRHAHASLAFIARPDAQGRFQFSAANGTVGYLDGLETCTDADRPQGNGPMGRAWREQQPCFMFDLKSEIQFAPWLDRIERFGLTSSAVLPIFRAGNLWALFCVYHAQKSVYEEDLRTVLIDLALDISRGLDRIDAQGLQAALLDNSAVGILIEKDRVIQRCNAHLAMLLGRPIAALEGQPAEVLFADAADFKRVGERNQELKETGATRVNSVALACASGDKLICDLSGIALADGEETMSVWTIENVTLRETQAQALARWAELNALLAEINRLGTLAQSEQEFFEATCRAAVDLASMQLAWMGRPSSDTGWFKVLAASGAVSYLDQVQISSHAGVPGGNGPTGQAWRDGRPVYVSRYRSEALEGIWAEQAKRYAFGSFAALPIRLLGQVTAVLTIYSPLSDVLDSKVQAVLAEIAASIERGLQSMMQRQRIAALQRLYQALMGEGEVVLQAKSEQDMLAATCSKLVDGTMFHAVWVGRPGAQDSMEALASAGGGMELVQKHWFGLQDVYAVDPVGQAWQTQRMACCNDLVNETQARDGSPEKSDLLRSYLWNAMLAAPIRRDGSIWGLLVFVSPQHQVFDEQVTALCLRVAELLGHGLDELDLKRRLNLLQLEDSHRARHDVLTGLPNRFALSQYLPHALARARRRERMLAVGVIDLDDFKPVNDSWGHAAGDLLLQEFSQRLQGLLRESDFLARMGGDEFVIVIEELEESQAQAQLKMALTRLHQAVETPFELAFDVEASISMTMGLALFPSDATEADALLRHADAAMYQAKQHKLDRTQWWRVGISSSDHAERVQAFDAYGEKAAALLKRTQAHFKAVSEEFADIFYAELALQPELAKILSVLTAEEMQRLKDTQSLHLRFLLDMDTSREKLVERAHFLGQLHALVGVSSAWMVQAHALYRKLLGARLNQTLMPSRDRYQISLVTDARLQEDLQGELYAGQATMDAYLQHLGRSLPAEGSLWIDFMTEEVEALSALAGILDVECSRPDSLGVFQFEAMAGAQKAAIRRTLLDPTYQPNLDPQSPCGQGVVSRAWRGETIVSAPSYMSDPQLQIWREVMEPLGVRSVMAFPVLAEDGHPVAAVRIFGAYPNQFESPWMRQFAISLQQRWGTAYLRCRAQASTVVPQQEAWAYREQLFAGGLRMVAQPVVDLSSGALVKAEALARLHMPDGRVISPGVFLPLLGTVELDRLFRLCLDQSLAHLVHWDAQGLHVGITVNLSPSTLLDLECPAWVQEALERHAVAPQRLTLELLETQSIATPVQDQAIAKLKQLGVRLAMDDLGSGYSSLQRLAALPFDTIKIDQSLLLHIRNNPVQTLGLVSTIIQMGRDFERDVVVEGLEDPDMVEAVAILGATHGQGYGLARPMPAEHLVAWSRDRESPRHGKEIRHFLGALAHHWRYMHDGQQQQGGPVEAGLLYRFIVAQGLEGGVIGACYREVYTNKQAKAAGQMLMDWLVESVIAQKAVLAAA